MDGDWDVIYLVDGLLSFDNITVAGAGGMEAFAAHEEETIEKLSTGVMIPPGMGIFTFTQWNSFRAWWEMCP